MFEQHGRDLAWDSKRVQMGSCFCNGTGGEGVVTYYFTLVTSMLIQLRVTKPKVAYRQILSKDDLVKLKKWAFLQRSLKHLRVNVAARGNRNNCTRSLRVLAC